MAFWGVIIGLSMGDWPPEKLRPLRGRIGLTDIQSPSAPATAPGSLYSKMLLEDSVSSPEDATPTLDALVLAAHNRGKMVIAYAA
ncbi:hypothetical protein NCS56_00785900 [Fusarium sp. Ph1]|nr:hypothetical protein NCS56_00785900 [Fusarium sp. Ph1]